MLITRRHLSCKLGWTDENSIWQ